MKSVNRGTYFYKGLGELAVKSNSFPMMSFTSNNQIPNFLRTNDWHMQFWCTKISRDSPIRLRAFRTHPSVGKWMIHVISQAIEVVEGNSTVITVLQKRTSWEIDNKMWLKYIRSK